MRVFLIIYKSKIKYSDEDFLTYLPSIVDQSDGSPLFVSTQVINGLMEREDWQEAIHIPLGILPGGSGNALAASIHHYSQWVRLLMSHLNAWTKIKVTPKKRTFLSLNGERFISFQCNYATGLTGHIIPEQRVKEGERSGTASPCGTGHFRLQIILQGVM